MQHQYKVKFEARSADQPHVLRATLRVLQTLQFSFLKPAMPKKLVFEVHLLNADLSVKSHQRLRVTLDTVEIEWPSIRQKLQDFCEKKGWSSCKVQYLNGTVLVELCDPSSLRRYLELHREALLRDTATLPLYLVPDPTDGRYSSTISGEEIVLEVDQEGSPIVLTLDSDILLGEGGFGKVLRAKDRETLTYYALKMSFQDEMSQKHMKTEISTLVQLTHPHIVSVLQHGCVLDPVNDRLPAYMMDLGLCSVDALLATGWHSKAAAHAAQRDVSSALQHLHSEKLGHMDVKPGNWLVTNKFTGPDGQTQLELKLIDAGGAGRLDKDPVTSCTAEYAHPMHQGEGSTHMIVRYARAFFDWYGLRVSIFQLLSSDPDHAHGVPTDQQVLQKASENVASDKKFILQAVQENGFALQFASETLQADEEVVMAAVRQHGWALQFASESLQNTQRIALEAVQQEGLALQFASAKLRSDKKLVMQAVQKDGSALRFACETLQSDKEVALVAVGQDVSALMFASKTLRADKDVVMLAIRKDGEDFDEGKDSSLKFACRTLQSDKNFVLEAVSEDGRALEFACKTLQADKEVVMTAIRKEGFALKFACKTLRTEKEVVMEAVRRHGRALRFASETLRTDRQVVLAAVQQDGSALKFSGKKLQSDKEIASVAVQQCGRSLEFVSPALQSQKDFVLEAVQENGFALQFASETLQADKDVVMAAVHRNGFALFYARRTLQSDKEVVMEAVRQDRFALNFACAILQSDKDVLALVKAQEKGASKSAGMTDRSR